MEITFCEKKTFVSIYFYIKQVNLIMKECTCCSSLSSIPHSKLTFLAVSFHSANKWIGNRHWNASVFQRQHVSERNTLGISRYRRGAFLADIHYTNMNKGLRPGFLKLLLKTILKEFIWKNLISDIKMWFYFSTVAIVVIEAYHSVRSRPVSFHY